jgi:hypothetical protein
MRRAPPGGCHSRDTQFLRLAEEPLTQIHVPGTGSNRLATAALDDLRTNFIARPAYSDPAVHYKLGARGPGG